MSRGIGEFGFIQDAIPEWLAVIIAVLTQLGDVWFLALIVTLCYWYGIPNRDTIAAIGGIWLAGMGLYKGLKDIFGLPRPDEPLLDPDLLPIVIEQLYEFTAFADGYGFPSGHAVNTTIVYFSLAHVLPVSTRPRRYAVAAALVGFVSFSRVALGVHYLVDVVVGVAIGFLLLLGARQFADYALPDPASTALAVAVAFGCFFVVASGADFDAILILALSLGAFAGWQLVSIGRALVAVDQLADAVRPVSIRATLAAVATAPLIVSLEYFPLLSVYAAAGVAGLLTGVAVTIPVAHHSRHARHVGAVIVGKFRRVVGAVRRLLSSAQQRLG